MMYKDKFVVAVKSEDGKILRENGDTVFIPFASEYSLQFKNLNTQRAIISVEIDGKDVLDGNHLIINSNDSINLERFVNDLSSGNKFKFIQKTQEIQEHRGDRIDDGFIRVVFQYEKPKSEYINPYPTYPHYYMNSNSTTAYPRPPINGTHLKGGQHTNSVSGEYKRSVVQDSFDNSISPSSASDSMFNKSVARGMSLGSDTAPASYEVTMDSFMPIQDEGITVKGSKSSQTFRTGTVGALETEKHTMILRVKGYDKVGNEIIEPLTINTKLTCSSCGTVWDSTHEFCGKCGTAL